MTEWAGPKRSMRFVLLALLAVSFQIGATDCDGHTDPKETRATFEVRSGPTGPVQAFANFEDDEAFPSGSQATTLAPDEALVAQLGRFKGVLTLDSAPNSKTYRAELPVHPASGKVQFRIYRDHDVKMKVTVLLLPEFSITAPTPGHTFRLSDGLPIAWSPSEGLSAMTIWFDFACVASSGGSVFRHYATQTTDDGTYVHDFRANGIDRDAAIDKTKPCDLSLSLHRDAGVSISPPWKEGSTMHSTQYRTVANVTATFL